MIPSARFFLRIFLFLFSVLGTFVLTEFFALQATNLSHVSASTASTILINEVDANTPGADTAEFVELYDGGQGSTSLDGLVLVFFNGQDDRAYAAFDLNGYQSDVAGYFLIANQSVPGVDLIFADSLLQRGPDAVALYQGTAADFPVGTAVTTNNLLDAIVYDTGDEPDSGLLILLLPGEPQVNEDSYTLADFHSNQRCPNGGGGARRTASYLQDIPTPKAINSCPDVDQAPEVSNTAPAHEAVDVAVDSEIIVTFSEPVEVGAGWYAIECTISAVHMAAVSGGDMTFRLAPTNPFAHDELCTVSIHANEVRDKDSQDPPDLMASDYQWHFSTVAAPVAEQMIINEVDADTPGSDTAEFIELSAGTAGNTYLDGLVVVLFNGSDDLSYAAYDLDGQQTNNAGYFVLGNAGAANVDLIIPNGNLQNGADAVALYAASVVDFPNGTPLTSANLLDALVYDTADLDDSELLSLLLAGEPQIDESGRGNPAEHSNQRCPDSSGGQRQTSSYLQNLPTPGAGNKCTFDSAPEVTDVLPHDGATDVAPNATLEISFSEAVVVAEGWFEISCVIGGLHSAAVSGNGTSRTLTPGEPFAHGDACTVSLFASKVSDMDVDDPPDTLETDFHWSFSTASLAVADHVLINEIDADTPGVDEAEFIELYDGGTGSTALDGLVVVLYNGSNDLSYRSLALDGMHTDSGGYFLLGNAAVPGVDLTFGNGVLQNGPDAVALYAGDVSTFPNGSPVTTNGLLDALVYDTADADDAELLNLLHTGQPQIDESGRGDGENHSNQRCPNGQGGQRMSEGYLQNPPTPKTVNECAIDQLGACGDPATSIHLIQGNGESSPLIETEVVIEGVVSGDFQGQDKLEGFFLQQTQGTYDNDPQTAEGIFVHDPLGTFHVDVAETVRLQGNIMEIDGMTSLGQVTELAHCGQALPPPPETIALPVADQSAWESFEGMLVHIPQILAATGSDSWGREGAVDLALSGRLIYATEIAPPGEAALAIADLNQRSRITLDDGSRQLYPLPLPPYLGLSNTLRIGDTVDGVTGILTEIGASYRLQPAEPPIFVRQEQRPLTPPEPGELLRLVGFDSGAYFNGDGQGEGFPGQGGAHTAEEFARQRSKIINALTAMRADVLVVYGIENDGYGAYSAMRDLVNGLNDADPGAPYAWVEPDPPGLGDTAAAVGMIYHSDRVSPVGSAVTTGAALFEPPNNRPLAQTFSAVAAGETFVLVAAQFQGRDICPATADGNEDQGDGQGCYALLRAQAAAALADWLAADPTESGQGDIVILGNLNAYTQEDPLLELQSAGYTDLNVLLSPGLSYTSVNKGETGDLQYALATPGITAKVQHVIQWHINAAEPQALDYRESNQPSLYQPDPYRSAAQDPLVVDLDLTGQATSTFQLFLPVTLFIK